MELVRDDAGRPLVPVERDGETWEAFDVATGRRRTLAAIALEPVTDEPPLRVAARALPPAASPPLDSIHDELAMGVLVFLDASGPHAVETLLGIDGLCESDLHGAVGELTAAGLVEETGVDGHRGYRTTERARDALRTLRD